MNDFRRKSVTALRIWPAILFASNAWAETKMPSMTEEMQSKFGSKLYAEEIAKQRSANEILGSARQNYRRFTERYVVPGFIRATPLPEIGVLAGPSKGGSAFFRIGDTVYFRWYGATEARAGDRYAIYMPKIILQNHSDPTDFMARAETERNAAPPEGYRTAGYIYETSGSVRVVRLNRGTVEARIDSLTAPITLGAHLMPMIPVKSAVEPLAGSGVKLAAAVVMGSPLDRLSTTIRSFIHLNRGSRDGIREGQIFEAVESVPMDGPATGPSPETSLGEAMVVYVSDAFSTAVITKQFDVIRVGALMKTKDSADRITPKMPFANLSANDTNAEPLSEVEGSPGTMPVQEIPDLEELKLNQDPTLPDPLKTKEPETPAMSELDALEQGLNLGTLTEDERKRLGKLSRQEKLEVEAAEDEAEAPTAFSNSFGKPPKKAEKAKPKSKKANDEEELNLLMMQN